MESRKSYYGWKLVIALWFIYFINMGAVLMGGIATSSQMIKYLSMEKVDLGIGIMVASLLAALASPFVSAVITKKGARYSLIIGTILCIIGSLLMGFVVTNKITFIVVFGIVIGLGVAFGGVLPIQTTVTNWFEARRAASTGAVVTALGLGGIIFAPMFTAIIESNYGDWQLPWKIVTGMLFVSIVLIMFFVINKPEDIGQEVDGGVQSGKGSVEKISSVYKTKASFTVNQAVKTGTFWIFLFGAISMMSIVFMLSSHTIVHLEQGLHHTAQFASLVFGVAMGINIIGRVLAGLLGDRVEPRLLFAAGLAMLSVGLFVVMKADSESPAFAWIFAICFGFGYGVIYVSLFTILGNYFGNKNYQGILAAVMLMSTILAGVSPVLAGKVFDLAGSYNKAFTIYAVMSAVSSVLMLVARPPEHVDNTE